MHLDYLFKLSVNCLAFSLFVPLVGLGQNQERVSLLSKSYNNSRAVYFNSIGPSLGLYNGVYFKEYVPHNNDQGQPYFGTDQWVDGNLFYNGMYYENIPLLYDVVNDKLILDHSFGAVKLELISEKLKYFIINGHRFVRLVIINQNSPVSTGFFELLYDGQTKLYAKWQKKRIEVINARELEVRYEDQNRIYINKGNQFYSVKTKSSVLHVLEDKKVVLKKYIKKSRLKFKSKRIESIAKVIAFYELGQE